MYEAETLEEMLMKKKKASNKTVNIPKEVFSKAMHSIYDEGGKELLEKILLKLPFAKDGDISTDKLERVFLKYEEKYDIRLGYISRYKPKDGKHMVSSFMLKTEEKSEWIDTVYAVNIWEGYAKLLILTYKYVQDGCPGGRE